jgi:hypothetical protein
MEGKTMTNLEAYRLLRVRLAACTDAQASDLRVILRVGAGDMRLLDRATMSQPAEIPANRRPYWFSLVDGIRYLGGAGEDVDEQEFRPVRAGAWEAVLATLVAEGEWDKVRQTADEIRTECIRSAVELIRETKDVAKSARLYEARLFLEKLLP